MLSKAKVKNLDTKVVEGFGDEWSRFDQSELTDTELQQLFDNYFGIFPWDTLDQNAVGFDAGCGSGRWAKLVAPRVAKLHLIDPSNAIEAARKNLAGNNNCEFHNTSIDSMPISDESADFGYSLGVLHHMPDTVEGLKKCTEKLKPGAPFLLYLYYNFDNKPIWYAWIWRCSELVRKVVSKTPHSMRYWLSQILAIFIYLPLAKGSLLIEKLGFDVSNFPLAQYRNTSFYTMRTDALDRFGTSLEQRFSKKEIEVMMLDAGLENITFSEVSFWTALGYKSESVTESV